MSMTDFFYSYGYILLLLIQMILVFFLTYLSYRFMCLFINPVYIWLDEIKRRRDYVPTPYDATQVDQLALNKTTRKSKSNETFVKTIKDSEKVIVDINELLGEGKFKETSVSDSHSDTDFLEDHSLSNNFSLDSVE